MSNFAKLAEWFGDDEPRLLFRKFAMKDSSFGDMAMDDFLGACNMLVDGDLAVDAIKHTVAQSVVKEVIAMNEFETQTVYRFCFWCTARHYESPYEGLIF